MIAKLNQKETDNVSGGQSPMCQTEEHKYQACQKELERLFASSERCKRCFDTLKQRDHAREQCEQSTNFVYDFGYRILHLHMIMGIAALSAICLAVNRRR